MGLRDIVVSKLVRDVEQAPVRADAVSAIVALIQALPEADQPKAKWFFKTHPAAYRLTVPEREQIQAA